MRLTFLRSFTIAASCIVTSCRQNDDPEGARQLFAKVTEGAGYRSWRRAPGYPFRQPSFTAHMDEVEIFVSPEISAAIDSKAKIERWPVGSIIVKDGYDGDEHSLVAIMEKRTEGWYWAEFDEHGTPLISGRPPRICVDCHDNRKDYSDWVYAFELPR